MIILYIKAPLNDPRACASFMGLKPSTTKCHLVRAILESISFRLVFRSLLYIPLAHIYSIFVHCVFHVYPCRNKQLYETMQRETHIPITKIRSD